MSSGGQGQQEQDLDSQGLQIWNYKVQDIHVYSKFIANENEVGKV